VKRRILNSLVLALLNSFAVVVGLVLFSISDHWLYFLLQGAGAVAVGVSLVVFWLVLLPSVHRMSLEWDFIYVFVGAFACGGILAAAAYQTIGGGGLNIAGAIGAFWAAQLLINPIGASIAAALIRHRTADVVGNR
jgi:hypothetical protein